MTSTVTKGLAMRSDLAQYDGTLAKSRTSSSGGTTNGLAINDYVDVLQVFGSGDTSNMTDATITTAINSLGSKNIALLFAPGTWTISSTVTIASNFTVICPAGCVFDVASTKTMTVSGVFFRQHATYSSGSGTFTITGTDLLAAGSTTSHYASDTGSADAYVIDVSDNPASYSAGQMYAFLAANANTGASTLNVDSLGAKDIKKYDTDGTLDALESGDIVANQIIRVTYDGTQFQLIPNVQMADTARLTVDNVYTKTETWKQGADVASATALPVNVDGNLFDVTGTTTITSIATKGIGTLIVLQFDGELTLTHHATDLILPGAANITTAAGDIGVFYEYASGDWRCVSWQPSGLDPSYEEGTFTPVLTDGSSPDATYTKQLGSYTKIGNMVFFEIHIVTSAIGTLSGAIQITGLPYTCNATIPGGVTAINFSTLNITAGQSITGDVAVSDTTINLRLWDATTGPTVMQFTEWSADGGGHFTGQYRV